MFFGTEKEFEKNAPYLFSWDHWLIVGLLLAIMIGSIWMVKKMNDKKTKLSLWVLWALMIFFDQLFQTIYAIKIGYYLWDRFLPLQICSIPYYIIPAILLTKNEKAKQGMLSFLCTFVFWGTLVNFVYPGRLNLYPAWSFAGLSTLIYHAILLEMIIVSFFSKLWKPKFNQIWWSLGLCIFFMTIALIVNIAIDANYFFIMNSEGTPFGFLYNSVPHFVYPIIVCSVMIFLQALYFLPMWISERRKSSR